MTERTHSQKRSASNDEQPDLSSASVTETGRDQNAQSVHLLLEEMRQNWTENDREFDSELNPHGDLAQKVPLLCNALIDLTNPVILRPSQQGAVREMILCEADNHGLLEISHPGDAARAVLAIATYINSCRP